MSILKKIGDGLKDGVQETKFKADQFLRIQQVESEIKNIGREISVTHEKLAELVYSLHKQGKLTQIEAVDICIQMDKFHEQIVQKQQQVEDIKNEKSPVGSGVPTIKSGVFCINCGANLSTEAEFCTNCGNKVQRADSQQNN